MRGDMEKDFHSDYFPAKTHMSSEGFSSLGISVKKHCLLTAYVIKYISSCLCVINKDKLIPESIALIAGVHDIGKISPGFIKKILKALPEDSADRQAWLDALAKYPKAILDNHALIGAYALRDMLDDDDESYRHVYEIVGAHHGQFPKFDAKTIRHPTFGGTDWQNLRKKFVDEIKATLKISDFPMIEDRQEYMALLNVWLGLVIVSDWIASQISQDIPLEDIPETARKLVNQAGFSMPQIIRELSFFDIFGFEPRALQRELAELYKGPGIYVIEAPTGYGKTEAALWLAYRALVSETAQGIYFALPTQLTSNRIYERFANNVESFLKESEVGPGIRLIHSSSRLIQTSLGNEASTKGEWFNSNRRAILAPFAVGTVDQSLLSVINAKFASVRAAGLLGKILIIDEVHSYDAYTSGLIKELIKRSLSLENTVILLSATLTNKKCSDLIDETTDHFDLRNNSPIRISIKTKDSFETVNSVKNIDIKEKLVNVEISHSSVGVFQEALQRAQAGEQVLWIENTISEAQAVYDAFKQHFDHIGLLHSRFRQCDRQKNENLWTSLYGKDGQNKRNFHGRVLVGTQVLEQSLDIDSDFLVTRIAPLDLLVQRLGRLWRHSETVRPPSCTEPKVVILSAPESDARCVPEKPLTSLFGKTGFVYSKYILSRTKKVLENRLRQNFRIKFPTEVRPLLEAVYCETTDDETEEEKLFLQEDKEKREKLDSMVLANITPGMQMEPDDICEKAVTRVIERESLPVIILEKDWITTFPKEFPKRMLWLEERLVNCTKKLDTSSSIPPDSLAFTMSKSKRFNGVSVLIMNEDGTLHTSQNEVLPDINIKYSFRKGLEYAS